MKCKICNIKHSTNALSWSDEILNNHVDKDDYKIGDM